VIGDVLLQSVAGRLVTCVRSSDTVSRQGGDEFVVLLSEIEHADDAAARAQKIIAALVAPHDVGPHQLHVNASIGISIYPDDGPDAETLIECADTAMYHAKESGRNQYQFFEREMNARAVERQWIEAGLHRALARREFVLHYQPKIELETGAITGAEVLIRWVHPERGLMFPKDFVRIAEDCGLIVPIGQWVMHEACRQVRAWIDEGRRPMAVAVNISAVEFRDSRFLEHVRTALNDSRLDARSLELELTESSLIQHAESTALVLQTLKSMGVQVAIDDFGTGYSSLSYLRQFPIDALKIDQSFVHEIISAVPVGTSIVGAVVSMGRSLGHRVIAEGVETREQLAFLRAQRCGEGQGYYFSRPLVAEQFVRLMETDRPCHTHISALSPTTNED
jgi:predicted signal transduction protein with EAL and GGDEF domain